MVGREVRDDKHGRDSGSQDPPQSHPSPGSTRRGGRDHRRGKPVGRIVPIRGSAVGLDALISDLEARGVLAEKRGGSRPHPPLPLQGGLAQKLLQEDRG